MKKVVWREGLEGLRYVGAKCDSTGLAGPAKKYVVWESGGGVAVVCWGGSDGGDGGGLPRPAPAQPS